MIEFLKTAQIELRLTVGQNWDNQFFSCKGPFFRKFTRTNFKHRGCEDHFSRNILMFNESMDHVNLRVTLGVSRDFDTDVSDVNDIQSIVMKNIELKIAPENYFSQNVALNALPSSWFNAIMGLLDLG